MIGGIPHYVYGSHRPMTSPGALVEAGSRYAGRRREGAAAGQSGRALRAGPVRDKEGRSKLSSLTMGSPAVQIPRAARRSSWSLEEARWSSAGAAAAGQQSRRHKSCELACRGRRERACVASTRTRLATLTEARLRRLFHSFVGVFPGLSKVPRLRNADPPGIRALLFLRGH